MTSLRKCNTIDAENNKMYEVWLSNKDYEKALSGKLYNIYIKRIVIIIVIRISKNIVINL